MKVFACIIKRWKENRRRRERERILERIKEAKAIYVSGKESFMCICFMRVFGCTQNEIQQIIPEFNRVLLNAESWSWDGGMWWLVEDRESRIKAFDKLIKIYSEL